MLDPTRQSWCSTHRVFSGVDLNKVFMLSDLYFRARSRSDSPRLHPRQRSTACSTNLGRLRSHRQHEEETSRLASNVPILCFSDREMWHVFENREEQSRAVLSLRKVGVRGAKRTPCSPTHRFTIQPAASHSPLFHALKVRAKRSSCHPCVDMPRPASLCL